MRPRILFQGSYRTPALDSERIDLAEQIARGLGKALIAGGLDLVLTGAKMLDAEIGRSAVNESTRLGSNARERIRTFLLDDDLNESAEGFGMVLRPADKRWFAVRTFVVEECDAVIALIGAKGTSDCLQKATLARKPVFPIPVAGGAAKVEWEHLRATRYRHPGGGDLEFLGDQSLNPEELCTQIVSEINRLLSSRTSTRSRRIFIVHGHDGDSKNHLARLLQSLDFSPIILAEQPEKGQALLNKLNSQLRDVAYAFVLYTEDDLGASQREPDKLLPRARQNVLFEHGLLLGLLGNERLCVIVRGDVELPSDLKGIVTKKISKDSNIDSIAFDVAKELSAAGYDLDLNKLMSRR